MTKLFSGVDKQPDLFAQWSAHRLLSITISITEARGKHPKSKKKLDGFCILSIKFGGKPPFPFGWTPGSHSFWWPWCVALYEYLCNSIFPPGFDPIDTRHRSKHYIHETHVYPPDRIISSFDSPAGITVRWWWWCIDDDHDALMMMMMMIVNLEEMFTFPPKDLVLIWNSCR